MSAEDDFRASLVASPAVVALARDAIAQNSVPEGTVLPYVVFSTVHSPIYGLDGTRMADQVSITAECWAVTAVEADALADAVESALRNFSPPLAGATVVARAGGFDEETELDATVLSIDWFTD